FWLISLALLAGVLGGMAWAAITACLRDFFNANEILVSLMLVYVAELLLSYLMHGALMDPDGFGFPQSKLFSDGWLIPILIPGTRDRKSTRLNSSHVKISYAVFCLK